jgi:hypothetical protein
MSAVFKLKLTDGQTSLDAQRTKILSAVFRLKLADGQTSFDAQCTKIEHRMKFGAVDSQKCAEWVRIRKRLPNTYADLTH